MLLRLYLLFRSTHVGLSYDPWYIKIVIDEVVKTTKFSLMYAYAFNII